MGRSWSWSISSGFGPHGCCAVYFVEYFISFFNSKINKMSTDYREELLMCVLTTRGWRWVVERMISATQQDYEECMSAMQNEMTLLILCFIVGNCGFSMMFGNVVNLFLVPHFLYLHSPFHIHNVDWLNTGGRQKPTFLPNQNSTLLN